MKTIIVRAALVCAVFAMSGGAADATEPVSFEVGYSSHDGIITRGATDARGRGAVALRLAPGRYAVVITGRDLIAAMDRMVRGNHRASCLTVAITIVGGAAPTTTRTPVCRDSGSGGTRVGQSIKDEMVREGLRIGFTISDQASAGNIHARPVEVRVSISDQGAAGGLSSY